MMAASGPAPDVPTWPLPFQRTAQNLPKTRFWNHELYRGPEDQPVELLYSRTKMDSEEIAKKFLGESVVGFDME